MNISRFFALLDAALEGAPLFDELFRRLAALLIEEGEASRIACLQPASEANEPQGIEAHRLGEGVGFAQLRGETISGKILSLAKEFIKQGNAQWRKAEGEGFTIYHALARGGSLGAVISASFPAEVDEAGAAAGVGAAASHLCRSLILDSPLRHEVEELADENLMLREELRNRYRPEGMIWVSGAMEDIFQTAMRAALSTATILIRGETGTGKEMLANIIHYNSPRAHKPFIRVNCASLTESLLESELFGHAKGAFSGATSDRKGRFEASDGGTIFLDEIGDISPRLQVRLLRVLQEREVTRVGENEPRKVNVRIIAATNRDLEAAVAANEFRADLYYRLNVVYLFIPPLRQRPEDIILLAEHFLSLYNQENFKRVEISHPETVRLLNSYSWPGNVRELSNAIQKAVVLAPGNEITPELLPASVVAGAALPRSGNWKETGNRKDATAGEISGGLEEAVQAYLNAHCLGKELPHGAVHQAVISRVEKTVIEDALRRNNGCQLKACRALGINRNTMRKKIAEYAIDLAKAKRAQRQ